MTATTDPVADRIQRSPKYQKLKSARSRFGWTLSVLMLAVYYGYIALIALITKIGRASCRERV